MDFTNNFSYNLRKLRLSKNLTQSEFAKFFNTSKQVISYYENGYRLPDLQTIIEFAKFFNCSVDSLIFSGTDINIDKLNKVENFNKNEINNSEYKYLIEELEKVNLLNKHIISLLASFDDK
ncbi:TPA: helix-turn-helix domain-containing protein [Clostridioides difficile]|uniref:helix-turn-helix domain-containing protein n=1 Tax=Clostridioides difficile TaxID=1496 RepID=UPI0008246E24|nr:helix-turn-helix domain-containing protein [Clostridioides difficile]EGT3815307.1 XRE family transcriptional regulator [Clostridioides difficile]EGT4203014.1 XRE family transcriptional regulator [Clostridioides difficile]EKJ1811798.1 helix-turn-helix transcriptional regulator [Clostridioides difficile]ELX4570458.1 helix-turn-helix transcriptional regulator [Clostridioides difficile]MBY1421650.1 helix-turn-helix domain-containing protein [Clostridioides difficile]